MAGDDGGTGPVAIDSINKMKKYNLLEELNLFFDNDNIPDPYDQSVINCKYYDEDSFLQNYKNTKNPIYMSLNIQSLNSKYTNLKNLLTNLLNEKLPIKILALQEIWQVPYLSDVKIPGFNFIQLSRKKSKGGGVGFYIKEDIKFKTITNLTILQEKVFECLTIEAIIDGKKIIFSNFYRSPNPPQGMTAKDAYDTFFNHFDNLLSDINNLGCKSFIFSDSNINLLKINNCDISETFFNNTFYNGFIHTIFRATRIQGNTYGLLDNIMTNIISSNLLTSNIISDIFDHLPIFYVDVDILTSSANTDEYFYSRNFNLTNMNNFRNDLQTKNWQSVTQNMDANSSYDIFWSIFKKSFDDFFPLKRIKQNKNIHRKSNFMTQGLMISRITKNYLHKAIIINPTEANIQIYKAYRNLYNSLIRKSKNLYYASSLNENRKKPKKVWDTINEALQNCKTSHTIPDLTVNGDILTDDKSKADAFNNFFTGIGNKITDAIPQGSKSPNDYIPNNPDNINFEFDEIGPVHLIDIIKSIPSKSSSDLNGISSKLIKHVKSEIATPLSHIFTLSLKNGIFPNALKCSRTVPIYKSGDKALCDNYRPISLVNTFSKLLEKIVAIKLYNHLDLNNLLYEHQYGFQQKKSTEHSILQLVNYVSTALNNNKHCIGVFLDIKKEFDCVDHNILFNKLNNFGIKNNNLKWFKSYLNSRTQRVDINGKVSDSKSIDIGVLQGSSLGPLLFLCFINDMPRSSTFFSLLFADDTACLAVHSDINILYNTVNTELQKIACWFKTNKLAVNVSKTKYVHFHYKQKKST